MKIAVAISLRFYILVAYSCSAADYGVTAFGRHEIDQSTGKKSRFIAIRLTILAIILMVSPYSRSGILV